MFKSRPYAVIYVNYTMEPGPTLIEVEDEKSLEYKLINIKERPFVISFHVFKLSDSYTRETNWVPS